LRRSTYFVKHPKLKAFFQWNSEKLVKKFKKWNHHFTIFHTGSRECLWYFTWSYCKQLASNLRQGNIKLLVANWAPLRYYLVAQLKFQSPWATVNFCPWDWITGYAYTNPLIEQSTHHVYMQFILITKHKHMYPRLTISRSVIG
jgi:hypothetical protein